MKDCITRIQDCFAKLSDAYTKALYVYTTAYSGFAPKGGLVVKTTESIVEVLAFVLEQSEETLVECLGMHAQGSKKVGIKLLYRNYCKLYELLTGLG